VLVQVWLALNNLVVDPHFRSKYKLDGFRKDTVCRIRRFLNDLLIDQLPVLKDLQRVVDEISLNYTPDFTKFESGTLVIEQVRIQQKFAATWQLQVAASSAPYFLSIWMSQLWGSEPDVLYSFRHPMPLHTLHTVRCPGQLCL
jgi:hypothetical protein